LRILTRSRCATKNALLQSQRWYISHDQDKLKTLQVLKNSIQTKIDNLHPTDQDTTQSLNEIKKEYYSYLEFSDEDLVELLDHFQGLESQLTDICMKEALRGTYDALGCYIQINSDRIRGRERSNQFVEILTNMYLRYMSHSHPYGSTGGFVVHRRKPNVQRTVSSHDLGLKATIIYCADPYSYGYLKHETGLHQHQLRGYKTEKFNKCHAAVKVCPDLDSIGDIRSMNEYVSTVRIPTAKLDAMREFDVSHPESGIAVVSNIECACAERKMHAEHIVKCMVIMKELGMNSTSNDTVIRQYWKTDRDTVRDVQTGEQWKNQYDAVLNGGMFPLLQSRLLYFSNQLYRPLEQT